MDSLTPGTNGYSLDDLKRSEIIFMHIVKNPHEVSQSKKEIDWGSDKGIIEYLGLWQDTGDRGMPISRNVDPGNKDQNVEELYKLVQALKAEDKTTGLICFQSYN